MCVITIEQTTRVKNTKKIRPKTIKQTTKTQKKIGPEM